MKMKNWKMFPVGRMLITRARVLKDSPLFILIFWAASLFPLPSMLLLGPWRSSLHSALPKEFIRANGIVSPMEGIPYVKI